MVQAILRSNLCGDRARSRISKCRWRSVPARTRSKRRRSLRLLDELIVPTSYKAISNDDPAFALFVFYLQAGLVEVLPQKWFTAAQYRVGQQWITRAARDPDRIGSLGNASAWGRFCWKKMAAGWREWIDAQLRRLPSLEI